MKVILYKGVQCKLSPVAFAMLFVSFNNYAIGNITASEPTYVAQNMEFDSSFLNISDAASVDLSRFSNGSSAMSGIYRTAIYVNDVLIGNKDVEFKSRADGSVYPCLTNDIIKQIGFNYDKLPKDFITEESKDTVCLELDRTLNEINVSYDSNEQRLDIIVPQVYMLNMARGSINPELWDRGIPAVLLGYNANAFSSKTHGFSYNSMFAGFNAGLNMGAWYLRHNGSYSWTENGPKKYSAINTYLQRDIHPILGRFLIGHSNTQGSVFDTLPFSGIQLASDERMLPASQRGYAPEIRGIARTSAKVTVRQGGQVLYETTVTPGEFLINDLYPTGYGGDLEVSVREADGTVQSFRVPYASVAQLLRPGSSHYSVTVGKLRSDDLREKPEFYQATYQRGLTNSVTGYGGLQVNRQYYALQLGGAFGTRVGALAFDVTQAHTRLASGNKPGVNDSGGTISGQSYRISYSKAISETNSNLSLAAYRFSTGGYMDFMTAMQARDVISRGYSWQSVWRAKNRFSVTAGQGLPKGLGQLYVSGSLQNYWNKDGSEKQFQVGYSNRYRNLTYGLSVNRSYSSYGNIQNNYLLSFSLPLGKSSQPGAPQLRTDLSHDSNGRFGQQANISGSLWESNSLSYGITAMNANQGGGSSGSINGQYLGSKVNVGGTYSTGKGYHSASMGLSGTLIGHSGGITFTPYSSDTFALVEAKGAEGARISSFPGIRVDSHGYAVVPYLNAYQFNEISLDPKGTAFDVELDNTTQKVVPYSGAVVKVKYNTKRGTPILINAIHAGQPVPFGADVIDQKGNHVGSVGQGGQIYARVVEQKSSLLIKWGEDKQMQCRVRYILIPTKKNSISAEIQRFTSVCEGEGNQIPQAFSIMS
jgi:outer membrane usher protein